MDAQIWQNLFPSTNWTMFLKEQGNPLNQNPTIAGPSMRQLVEECGHSLELGQVGKAIDRISLGVILNKNEFLSRLKKGGILRHSTYINRRNPVAGIAKHLLSNRDFFHLTDAEVLYFESLENIESYATEMKNLFQSITKRLLTYKSRKLVRLGSFPAMASIVKSFLALNDYAFLTRENEDVISLKETVDIKFTIEERSDAISLLISRIDELIQIEPPDLLAIDEAFITSGNAEKLIVDACRFKAYKEFEILIESLGYTCKKDGKIVRITYEDDRTLKSLELSHIMGNLQKSADAIWIKESFSYLPSMKELTVEINKHFPDIVQLKTHPYPRFTMNLPDIVIAAISKEDIGHFSEEYDTLEYIQNEMSLSLDDLEKYEIVSGLTLYEFMKIDRSFAVLQQIFSERVRELASDKDYLVLLNSILAFFKEEKLVEIFDGIIPGEKILKYLSVMSWETGNENYLDLQYTPIVKCEKNYSISLSVMRHSRTIRNVSASLAKRGTNSKGDQSKLLKQVPEQLTQIFTERGFTCYTDLKMNFKGTGQNEGDIDFFAYREGHLFIAECKDVLDSVDPFEYRRVNDYLLKAATQLDYLKSAINDPVYQASLSKRVKIDLSKLISVHYLIVPTARKMFGHRIGDYPVRNMHELMNYVKEGVWNYRLPGGNLHRFKLWHTDDFQIEDLITYCSDEGPHNELIKGLVGVDNIIGKHTVERRYGLDINAAFSNLKNRYRFVVEPEQGEVLDNL